MVVTFVTRINVTMKVVKKNGAQEKFMLKTISEFCYLNEIFHTQNLLLQLALFKISCSFLCILCWTFVCSSSLLFFLNWGSFNISFKGLKSSYQIFCVLLYWNVLKLLSELLRSQPTPCIGWIWWNDRGFGQQNTLISTKWFQRLILPSHMDIFPFFTINNCLFYSLQIM